MRCRKRLTIAASRQCDHSEMAVRPIVAARLSTFVVILSGESASNRMLERVLSGFDGRQKSDKASNDRFSSGLIR